jgi:hypothetical protein
VASKKRASDTTSVGKSQKISPNEAVTEAIIGYMKVKEAAALNPRNMTKSLGVELQTFMHTQSTMEKMSYKRSRHQ